MIAYLWIILILCYDGINNKLSILEGREHITNWMRILHARRDYITFFVNAHKICIIAFGILIFLPLVFKAKGFRHWIYQNFKNSWQPQCLTLHRYELIFCRLSETIYYAVFISLPFFFYFSLVDLLLMAIFYWTALCFWTILRMLLRDSLLLYCYILNIIITSELVTERFKWS